MLKTLQFMKSNNQLHLSQVDESMQLACLRIRIERVIGYLKDFRLLKTIVSNSEIYLLHSFMALIWSARNLNKNWRAR